jgi:hypothetical protein
MKTQESRSLPVTALWLQWLASVNPLNSRAAATDLHRLPEHEVCDECGGAAPAVRYQNRLRKKSGRVEVDEKSF